MTHPGGNTEEIPFLEPSSPLTNSTFADSSSWTMSCLLDGILLEERRQILKQLK